MLDINKINILVPMAGLGKRFQSAGYRAPKPLIRIANKFMFEWALKSIDSLSLESKIIFVALRKDLDFGLQKLLSDIGVIVSIDNPTEGAVSTTLEASTHINNETQLLIMNCDQFLDWNIDKFIDSAQKFDASVAVFESKNPHHSYIDFKGQNVIRVEEKQVISNLACGGVYYYRRGLDYINSAHKLIEKNYRTNGEFYISPVFNELLLQGKQVTYFKLNNEKIHMLGTPEEVAEFENKLKTEEALIE
jgi:dTDP-glucose pyrophosphorylase